MFRVSSPQLNTPSTNSNNGANITRSYSLPDIKIHEFSQKAEKIGKMAQPTEPNYQSEQTYTLSARPEEYADHFNFNEGSSSRLSPDQKYPTAFSAQFHTTDRAKRTPFEASLKTQQLEEQYNHLDDLFRLALLEKNSIGSERNTFKNQAEKLLELSNFFLTAYRQKNETLGFAHENIEFMIAKNVEIAEFTKEKITALKHERGERIQLAQVGKDQRLEIESLKKQLAEARQATDDLKNNIQEKDIENKQLSLENGQLSTRLNETETDIEALTNTNKELVSKLTDAKNENETLSQRGNTLQLSLNEAYGSLGQAKNDISSLKSERANLSLRLAAMEKKQPSPAAQAAYKSTKDQAEKLEKNIQELNSELTEKQKQLNQLETKHTDRGYANEKLKGANLSLKANLNEANTKLTGLRDQLTALKEELDKAKGDLTPHIEKYNKLKDEYDAYMGKAMNEKMNIFAFGATIGAFAGYFTPRFT